MPKMKSFLQELTGCLSQGAAGNPTVAMVEAAYAHHGLPWRYVNFEVAPADLSAAVAGARALGFRGFNLSMPHKVSVIPLLDRLGESAALIGAVNCVVRRDEAFVGENTDGKGFLASLRTVIDPAGKNVVLFGAGGAARAIAVELALIGVHRLLVVNRSEARGAALAADLSRTRSPALATWRAGRDERSESALKQRAPASNCSLVLAVQPAIDPSLGTGIQAAGPRHRVAHRSGAFSDVFLRAFEGAMLARNVLPRDGLARLVAALGASALVAACACVWFHAGNLRSAGAAVFQRFSRSATGVRVRLPYSQNSARP